MVLLLKNALRVFVPASWFAEKALKLMSKKAGETLKRFRKSATTASQAGQQLD
jgi:hypothetical protein